MFMQLYLRMVTMSLECKQVRSHEHREEKEEGKNTKYHSEVFPTPKKTHTFLCTQNV